MEQLKHDTAAAIDFLRRLSPEHGWSLTAIEPDGGAETRTFKPSEADAAAAWIEGHQGKRGIYYHINLVRSRLTKKASKEQIAGFRAFHIDVDPRAGEELASEQERIYKLLTTPRDGVPSPSLIVSSGGGYQAVWLLSEPLMIPQWKGEGNEPPELLLGEAINRGLQNAYSKDEARADNTQDCTRLLRLPGTINVPNKKKAAKGRGPALSSLVPGADFSRRYAAEDFDKLKAYADQPKEAAPLATAGQVAPRSKQPPRGQVEDR